MNKKNKEITALLLASFSVFILISLIQFQESYELGFNNEEVPLTGQFGALISAFLVKWFLGYGSFVVCSILFMYSYLLFFKKDYTDFKYLKLTFYQLGLGLWVAIFFAYLTDDYNGAGGAGGFILKRISSDIVGNFIYVLLPIALIIILRGFFNFSIYNIFKSIFKNFLPLLKDFLSNIKQFIQNNLQIIKTNRLNKNIKPSEPKISNNQQENINVEEQTTISDDTNIDVKNPINIKQQADDAIDTAVNDEQIIIEEEDSINTSDIDLANKQEYSQYKLPSSTLLNDPIEIKNMHSEKELKEKADQLIHALETFGVHGKVIRISPGPVITLFEIEPAEGVRVNRFVTLSDDLARVMQAQRIRVIAPIPGSRSVGIELPNKNPQMVFLQTILNSEQYVDSDSKLTIAIGKTTTGDAFTFDLGALPHLLIAGATGAGKSVCINTIIMSILYKAKPDEVKFILIDPKKLELSTYKKLVGYHLTTAPNLDEYVMTTADNAVGILDASIHEMERRFSLFADSRVRNIKEYHQKCITEPDLETIPYLVVLIDELADLMMTSAKAIEDPITRLAQKARAVGIHLVVATQRPSVDVITGLIKSNFPARLSFQVSSRVDSRTILDQMGAEKLLGKGDLLFLKPGSAAPIRLHNAFVTLDEIEKVLSHINEQPKPDEIKLPEVQKNISDGNTMLNDEHDELLLDAAKLVVDTGQASVSLLQRRFRIGYARAGRLIDELESLGIITGHSGSKAREVLVDYEYVENLFNK